MKYRPGSGDLSISSQKASKPVDVLFEEFYQSITGEKLEAPQDAVIREIYSKLQTGGDSSEADPTGI